MRLEPKHLSDLQLDVAIADRAARLESLTNEFDELLAERDRRDGPPQIELTPAARAYLEQYAGVGATL